MYIRSIASRKKVIELLLVDGKSAIQYLDSGDIYIDEFKLEGAGFAAILDLTYRDLLDRELVNRKYIYKKAQNS